MTRRIIYHGAADQSQPHPNLPHTTSRRPYPTVSGTEPSPYSLTYPPTQASSASAPQLNPSHSAHTPLEQIPSATSNLQHPSNLKRPLPFIQLGENQLSDDPADPYSPSEDSDDDADMTDDQISNGEVCTPFSRLCYPCMTFYQLADHLPQASNRKRVRDAAEQANRVIQTRKRARKTTERRSRLPAAKQHRTPEGGAPAPQALPGSVVAPIIPPLPSSVPAPTQVVPKAPATRKGTVSAGPKLNLRQANVL